MEYFFASDEMSFIVLLITVTRVNLILVDEMSQKSNNKDRYGDEIIVSQDIRIIKVYHDH